MSIVKITFGIFIVISFFCGCGGGDGHKDNGQSTDTSTMECSICHGIEIENTHFDLPETNLLEGYVFEKEISWAPGGTGYVLNAGEQACATSCHDYHNGDSSVNKEWLKSGHSDIKSEAFTHNFTRGSCLKCHSGIGFASYVDINNNIYPDWLSPTEEIYAHYITCNACHDAEGYPDHENNRLRKSGNVWFVSGSSATFVQDAIIDAGDSATCFVCHQGTQSGWSLYRTIKSKGIDPYDILDETMTGFSFVDSHYVAAAATLYSLKGFEFKDKAYSNGNILHQTLNCVGCHMSYSEDNDLGGHTFNLSHEGKMNTEFCRTCHPELYDFKNFKIFNRDMDGDSIDETIYDEIEGLKELVISELEKAGIYYNPVAYPYFFNVPAPHIYPNRVTVWKESQIKAAFNLHFIEKEPGVYIHNFKYAVQLLRDSYEALTGMDLKGMRPSSSDDRPAVDYSKK